MSAYTMNKLKVELFFYKILIHPWSFFVNILYWIPRLGKIKKTIQNLEQKRNNLKTLHDVKRLMDNFIWKEDSFKDWRPWVITIIDNNLHDDCDGAAVLGKWALKQIGIKSRIISLRGKGSGHAVCVSKENDIMITNHKLIILDPNNFPSNMFAYFNNNYNIYR